MEHLPSMMLPGERNQFICDYILEKGGAQIKELSLLLHVSEATIRRDLDELAAKGLIERIHGGGMPRNNYSTTFERIHDEKLKLQLVEKKKIGQHAAGLVQDGDSIFLDTGTTSYQLALGLSGKENITVITNDLFIATNVDFHPSANVVLTGGIKRSGYSVLIGSMVEEMVRDIRVDIVFLTADAIDETFGISNTNFSEAAIKKLLLKAGKKVILIADHTKFGTSAVVKVCDLDAVDIILTDVGLGDATKECLLEQGCDLVLV